MIFQPIILSSRMDALMNFFKKKDREQSADFRRCAAKLMGANKQRSTNYSYRHNSTNKTWPPNLHDAEHEPDNDLLISSAVVAIFIYKNGHLPNTR
jgi:hypothetical protein